MGKIVAWGDLHGRPYWETIIKLNPDADIFLSIGDYWDSGEFTSEEQIENFNKLIAFKKENPDRVILLKGNHDNYGHPDIQQFNISGFQDKYAFQIGELMQTNKDLFQMAYAYDNLLFTHAGVSEVWITNSANKSGQDIPEYTAEALAQFVNDMWKHKPAYFDYISGGSLYGDDPYQGPIWIRPRSLQASAKKIKKSVIQVVGHTGQNQIDIEGKSTGGKYFYIDTLGSSREYLIYDDEIKKFSTRSLEGYLS